VASAIEWMLAKGLSKKQRDRAQGHLMGEATVRTVTAPHAVSAVVTDKAVCCLYASAGSRADELGCCCLAWHRTQQPRELSLLRIQQHHRTTERSLAASSKVTESSRATQPVLDLHQPFLRVHFHQRHPQQSGNTRHQQNSPCRGRGQKMFVPSWENPDSEDTQQWFGQALTLQSAHFQQWEHRAWSTFRKEMLSSHRGLDSTTDESGLCSYQEALAHT